MFEYDDHIWVNCFERVSENGIVMSTLPDQYGIFACLDCGTREEDMIFKKSKKEVDEWRIFV